MDYMEENEINQLRAKEKAELLLKINKKKKNERSFLILDIIHIAEFDFSEVPSSKYVDSLEIVNRGGQILQINLLFFEKFPNLEYLSLKGEIIIIGEERENYPLTNIGVGDTTSVQKRNNMILNIIRNSDSLSKIRFSRINDFSFLNGLTEITCLDRLALISIDNLSDPDLVRFVEQLTVDNIYLSYCQIKTFHDIYVKNESVNKLEIADTEMSAIPQSVINRISRYRLTGAEKDEFILYLSGNQLPLCIDNKKLEFPEETVGKYRFSPNSIEIYQHYIKEHHEPSIFETLESCNQI